MSIQVGASCKTGLTLSTGKWLFTSVHPYMAHKVSVVFEHAGAKLAHKLFTAGGWFVRKVAIQPLLSLESCATVWTHKLLLIRFRLGVITHTSIVLTAYSVGVITTTWLVKFSVHLALFLVC